MNRREFLRRSALGAAVAVVATFAYRTTQFLTHERAAVRTECWTWNWLPFHPAWLWLYVSMFVIVGLPWYLLPEWRQVRRFAVCLVGMAAVGWITFLLHPTACARPTVEGPTWSYALLLALDRPNNCLPCLHSAMALLAAGVLAADAPVFRSWLARVALWAWCAAIVVSIVALRQHTDIDTLVGLGLGSIALGAYRAGRRGQ
jgi:membrane-associated phospholipid phosphatase